jgi:hypothetical protein
MRLPALGLEPMKLDANKQTASTAASLRRFSLGLESSMNLEEKIKSKAMVYQLGSALETIKTAYMTITGHEPALRFTAGPARAEFVPVRIPALICQYLQTAWLSVKAEARWLAPALRWLRSLRRPMACPGRRRLLATAFSMPSVTCRNLSRSLLCSRVAPISFSVAPASFCRRAGGRDPFDVNLSELADCLCVLQHKDVAILLASSQECRSARAQDCSVFLEHGGEFRRQGQQLLGSFGMARHGLRALLHLEQLGMDVWCEADTALTGHLLSDVLDHQGAEDLFTHAAACHAVRGDSRPGVLEHLGDEYAFEFPSAVFKLPVCYRLRRGVAHLEPGCVDERGCHVTSPRFQLAGLLRP